MHGAAFIAPRILPASLVKRAEGMSRRNFTLGCMSPQSTGTQSTASSAAGSPTKRNRNESGEPCLDDGNLAFNERPTDFADSDAVLNTSKHKGFIGFSFHRLCPSKTKGILNSCKQTLVLFEAMESHGVGSIVGNLPHFSRKRYGT